MSTEKAICPGFKAAGVAAGIKKNGKKDLGLLFSERPAVAAAVFTKNRVKAAPVLLDERRIRSGRCRAIIANSGNANCCTGEKGLQDAAAMARHAAERLRIPEEEVLAASTGVIGAPLPIEKVEAAVPELVESLRPDGFFQLAEAVMTTDTVPKVVSRKGKLDGRAFTVTGVAKGAGMIRPDMATMLCFVATDIESDAETLSSALSRSTDRSFNRITIDGDTSTNDTVIVLANGASGARIAGEAAQTAFQSVLDEVLFELAKAVVKDGEGVTKFVEVRVTGAADEADARKVADTVAHSNLFKTALFGEDANWGRILAAAGRSGVPIDPALIDVSFDGVMMVENGVGCGEAAEAGASAVLKEPEFTVAIDLHMGSSSYSIYTCDFSIDYVKINADYRS
ncbi:MAG: bifunctional glutamate N-acetyltransferase/amino-acid acetyltransferase ArgJ [Desulfobacteraceae bacterium]|nr:MAG: bifunctional glutamate N-acetyltransferase/amino-acid acetyltransferase ArgJ [Desulfobacteraceae bacterium]